MDSFKPLLYKHNVTKNLVILLKLICSFVFNNLTLLINVKHFKRYLKNSIHLEIKNEICYKCLITELIPEIPYITKTV